MRFAPALLAALAVPALLATPAHATELSCTLKYNLSGGGAFYKRSTGEGTITCDNGQSLPVTISAKGGGVSFGKQKIEGGTGEFSGVKDIKETLGSYAAAEAHAGAAKSGGAQVMTKGEVSLALAGAGKGWDIGIAFGKFTIAAR